MRSAYCAIGITCTTFLWLDYLKKREKTVPAGWLSLAVSLGVTRPLMFFVSNQPFCQIWVSWAMDLVIMGFLLLLIKRERGMETARYGVWLYLWNPAVAAAVVSQKPKRMLGVWLFIMAGALVWQSLKLTLSRRRKQILYRHLAGAAAGAFGCLAAADLFSQSYAQCRAGDETIPVLWILSAVVFAASVLSMGFRLFTIKVRRPGAWRFSWKKNPLAEGEEEPKDRRQQEAGNEQSEKKERIFSGRDVIYSFGLTLLFAFLAFWRLGSASAPQTFLAMDQNSDANRQIVLKFDQPVRISRAMIYLGPQSKRSFSFSIPNENGKGWKVIASKKKVESVFCWNEVKLDCTTWELGIVSMDSSAYINEIVLLDEKGAKLLPSNALQYEKAFDEQKLYPDYPTYYYRTMFDEVYHARTAYETIHGLPIYEISHPPLGKNLISLGIALFGMTPFGWRFVCALCGILMVPVLYVFMWRISGDSENALFAAGLFSLDFMHLTLSRIATVDIIVALFILLMFCLMYGAIETMKKSHEAIEAADTKPEIRRRLFLREAMFLTACGIVTGCGVAVKWTAVYGAAGLGVLLFWYLLEEYGDRERQRKARGHLLALFGVCVFSFFLIPAAVCVLSYVPYVTGGREGSLLQTVIENGKYMLNYHKKTVFDHPYSSEWYEWPWIKQPLLDAYTALQNGKVSIVSTFGNPVIWWGGIGAFFHNLYLWQIKKVKSAGYLIIAYLSMLLPWLFIHRTVFIYQYFICSVLLVLLLGNSFRYMKHSKRRMALYGGSAALVFLLFYPVLSGYPVNRHFAEQALEWLESWVLS